MSRHLAGAEPLQRQLDEITASTRALVPVERLAPAERLVRHLEDSGLASHLLASGSQAPCFALPSATGKTVRSQDLLALGTLVIKFFRGRWDPYDMTELEAWQTYLPALRSLGALLVAISPQTQRQNSFTVERHGLTFPVLSDPSASLAGSFGIAYEVPEEWRSYYRSILVNIPLLNGNDSWLLPLPATVLLDRRGVVLCSETYADHRIRPEPTDLLDFLLQR